MKFKHYCRDLPNWTAVQARFGIKRSAAPYVYTLADHRYGHACLLVLHSDDGESYTATMILDGKTRKQLRGCSWKKIAERLAELSPVAKYYRGEIEAWIEHVRPPAAPEIVSLHGPENQIGRLLRNALGVTGSDLMELTSRSKLLRVDPAQFYALAFWGAQFPSVRICGELHDARV